MSRHYPHPKWILRKQTCEPQARPRLNADDIQELAAKMQVKFGWDSDPHRFQLQAVQSQLESTDTILQAPTGAGKTAIAAGPYAWLPPDDKKITIMVSPLLALEEEMVSICIFLFVQITKLINFRLPHSAQSTD